ncbi:hypothetical protein CB1_001602002 [Camelus ferus]|nr:hypothetical protein CB1_001602002 [Camelus ferus]
MLNTLFSEDTEEKYRSPGGTAVPRQAQVPDQSKSGKRLPLTPPRGMIHFKDQILSQQNSQNTETACAAMPWVSDCLLQPFTGIMEDPLRAANSSGPENAGETKQSRRCGQVLVASALYRNACCLVALAAGSRRAATLVLILAACHLAGSTPRHCCHEGVNDDQVGAHG